PRAGVMRLRPKKRDEDIVTPAMKRTILITAGFFVVVMLALLVLMKGSPQRPGLFAEKDQLWSVEVAGTRVAEPWEKLYRDEAGHWRLMTQPRNDALDAPVTPAVWVQNKEDPEVEVSFTVLQV